MSINKELLRENAQRIVSKTILAADESSGTIKDRFDKIGVESTPETNRKYRLMLFTAPKIEDHVSGVILYEETLKQKTDDGKLISQYLAEKGIMPGIKVDKGTELIPGFGKDKFTQGLDGLGKRLDEYKEFNPVFAKWRSVITIGVGYPKHISINRNAHDLALYAAICQDRGIVPIVEPEVLMDGTHSFEDSRDVTRKVLENVFRKLEEYGVYYEGMILKPNMITPNKENLKGTNAEKIAKATYNILIDTVPARIPGVAFLSGGQSPEMATINLNAINILNKTDLATQGHALRKAMRLTASYGRALQGEALEAWKGKEENIPAAQTIFIDRARKVHAASNGEL
jgi:fructose-bisphosphate aldolase, class I